MEQWRVVYIRQLTVGHSGDLKIQCSFGRYPFDGVVFTRTTDVRVDHPTHESRSPDHIGDQSADNKNETSRCQTACQFPAPSWACFTPSPRRVEISGRKSNPSQFHYNNSRVLYSALLRLASPLRVSILNSAIGIIIIGPPKS